VGTGGASVTVFVDSVPVGSAAVTVNAIWALALATPLAAGQVVTARQTFGEVDSTLSEAVIVISPTPPPDVEAGLVAGDTTIRGTGLTGATVQVFVDAQAVGTTSVNADFTWSLPVPPLTEGQVVTATETVNGFVSPLSDPVVVGAAVLRQIVIAPAPTASVVKGLTVAFSAQGVFSDGTVQAPLSGVVWSSSAQGVASISAAGLATGVTAGLTTITASRSGVTSAGTLLTVLAPVATSLQLTPLTPPLGLGDTLQFQATATFSDNTTQDRTALVTWATSAPTIAPITAAGLATGQSEGQATITATDPTGLTASTLVTVILPAPVITALVPATGTIGTAVTITGKYFQTLQAVAFNGLPAVVLQKSATSLLTTVPIGATTGPVTVTTTRGTASMVFTVTLTGDFTLTALPTPPATLKVIAGDQGYAAVQAGGSGSFTSLISLATGSLPTGVTASFGPQLVAPGSSSFLALSIADTTASAIYTLTVSGTAQVDGNTITRTATVTLEVLPPGTTAVTGRILTAESIPQPIPGVTVVLGGATTFTDAAGNFVLQQAPPGPNLLFVDGRTASTPAAQFPIVETQITVNATGPTRVPFIIYLPKLDTANAVNLPTDAGGTVTQDFTVTTPAIPGLEIKIPAGTRIIGPDGNPVTQIIVTPVPIDRSPMPFPPGLSFPSLFAIHPGGSVPSQPLAITFPNVRQASPGSQADLYYFDLTIGNWNTWGTGTVSSDGARIPSDPGYGLPRFAWHSPCDEFCFGPPLEDPPGNTSDGSPASGDPVELFTGRMRASKTDMVLSGRVPVFIQRTYRGHSSQSGVFGLGWNLTPYDAKLLVQGSSMVLINPDQSRDRFVPDGAGRWINKSAPYMQGAVITQRPGDFLFQLRFKDGTVHRYDRIVGFSNVAALAAIVDRNGNTLTTTREGSSPGNFGRITKITEPTGRNLTLAYDNANRVVSITDPLNAVVSYTYDTSGRLETVTDPAGGVNRYTYDPANNLLSAVDARGNTVSTNEYDASGRVLRQTQADGGVWTFAYTTVGNLVTETAVTDPRGNMTRSRFGSQGFLLSIVDALGRTKTSDYDTNSNVIAVTDALVRATRLAYDANGNLTTATNPTGQSVTLAYDPVFSRLTSMSKPLVPPTQYESDARGNRSAIVSSTGARASIDRDGFGQPITVTDPLNRATTFAYDSSGNLASITDALGSVIRREYDSIGRVTRMVDPLGRSIALGYDVLNRITRITDSIGSILSLAYDPNGNLTSIVDRRGGTVVMTYDSLNRLRTRTAPGGGVEQFEYDAVGNVVRTIDRKGQETTAVYDSVSRPTSVRYADGSQVFFTYDAISRLVQIDDSNAGSIIRTYDQLNRLVSETAAVGTITYEYDALGRRTRLGTPGQPPVAYAYDAASRLASVTSGTTTVTFDYNAAGQRTRLTLPNDVTSMYQYDAVGRLIALNYTNATGSLGDLTYGYDAVGNRTQVGGSLARTLLPDVVADGMYGVENRQLGFGNRQMTYDANGNLTSITEPAGLTALQWDVRNRLVGLEAPGVMASFAYDAAGRRVLRSLNGVSTQYVYDGLSVVQERSGTETVDYLNGLRIDERFVRRGAEFYVADGLGSSIGLTDVTGAFATRYTYEPFGRSETEGTSSNAFQFTGRENDATGLQYFRARYYAPALHRFIGQDAAAEAGANRYLYVGNNPINAIDLLGLFTIIIHGSSASSGPGGSLFGGGNLGLNAIEAQLNLRGEMTQSFNSGEIDKAIEAAKLIQSIDPNEPIHIIGHSMGGDAAIDVATGLLQSGIVVDNLIPIDPFSEQEREIDARIRTLNFRQQSGLPFGSVLKGASVSEEIIDGLGLGGHFDITGDSRVRDRIIDIIRGTTESSTSAQPLPIGGPPK
jgi:RHS repeat-associated protein